LATLANELGIHVRTLQAAARTVGQRVLNRRRLGPVHQVKRRRGDLPVDHTDELAIGDAAGRHHVIVVDLLTSQRSLGYTYAVAKGLTDASARTDVLQGTLDLMVLKTLDSMGPQHGYGIARRIEQVSDAVLTLNEGTVYASLMRLQHYGWILANWGASENNRKAKFYSITRTGRRQLARETASWERIAGVIQRLLRTTGTP
jgi:transcriptional regulator